MYTCNCAGNCVCVCTWIWKRVKPGWVQGRTHKVWNHQRFYVFLLVGCLEEEEFEEWPMWHLTFCLYYRGPHGRQNNGPTKDVQILTFLPNESVLFYPSMASAITGRDRRSKMKRGPCAGVMEQQAKECWQPWQEADSPLESPEGTRTANISI